MRCTNPLKLRYKHSQQLHTVACGACMACRISRVQQWTQRLEHENMLHKNSIFLTLSYDNTWKDELMNIEDLQTPMQFSLNHEDIKLFFKKLRKKIKTKISYYCSGEYGEETFRPHYHLIIFGLSKKDKLLIHDTWGKGNIKIGDTNHTTIRYTCGYIIDKLTGKFGWIYEALNIKPPYCAVSHNLGLNYAKNYFENWIDIAKPMSRYYKKKLDTRQILDYNYNNSKKGGKINYKQHFKEVDENTQRELTLQKKQSLNKKKL
nr:MAG: replication initiator protein [Microviridae sp.]